jgi:hypothetical protein
MDTITKKSSNKACERCGRSTMELEPFEEGKNKGAYLIKIWRENNESGVKFIEQSWECRDCVKEGKVINMEIEV